MNYSLRYPDSSCRYLTGNNKVEEIIIQEFNLSIKPQLIWGFPSDGEVVIESNWDSDQSIEDRIKIYKAWREVYPFLSIAIHWTTQQDLIDPLKEAGIPWFYTDVAKNHDTFSALMKRNPSQIYIAEELGFQLKDVRHRVGADVQVRVYGNIAQADVQMRGEVEPWKKFWIRPEDVKYYEDWVDKIVLVGTPDRLSVVYEIYRKEWWGGALGDLIGDIVELKHDMIDPDYENISNRAFEPLFGEQRLNCKRRCDFGMCHYCQFAFSLAEQLTKANIEVVQPSNKMDTKYDIDFDNLTKEKEKWENIDEHTFNEEINIP